jgi:hypothetical protein
MRSTVVAEKGWTLKNLKLEKRDAAVSASMMFFLSLVILAVSAGTLHVMGMKMNNTVEMISLFEPPGGKIAAFILILGNVGAGISSIFPIILIAPRLISDFTGRPRTSLPMYRALGTGPGSVWIRDAVHQHHPSPAHGVFTGLPGPDPSRGGHPHFYPDQPEVSS